MAGSVCTAEFADRWPGSSGVPQHRHRDPADNPPRVPRDVNPTAAYARDFDLPATWAQRETFLRFDGVTSGYFVWVNGKDIGYDQGGYTPAEFDISSALRPGRNQIAVQVHRWSAGAYLEDVDQWRYSGIFRSVTLYSAPATFIRDVTLRTDLDSTYTDDLDRAAYPFQLQRDNGWFTLHASHAVTGVGDTPNPVRERSQVQPDVTYEYTLSLRPLTTQEARAGLPAGG